VNTNVFELLRGRERDEMGPKVILVYLHVCPTTTKSETLMIASVSPHHLILPRTNLLKFVHATVLNPRRLTNVSLTVRWFNQPHSLANPANVSVRIFPIIHPDLLRSRGGLLLAFHSSLYPTRIGLVSMDARITVTITTDASEYALPAIIKFAFSEWTISMSIYPIGY
jgi:hypothetical protein